MAKSRKNRKSRLPKRVAGFKIPKALRKGRAARFLTSPMGIAVMSELAVHAGLGAAKNQSRPGSRTRRLADHPIDGLKDMGSGARDAGLDAAASVRAAFAVAADAFTDALQGARDQIDSPKKSRRTGTPAGAH